MSVRIGSTDNQRGGEVIPSRKVVVHPDFKDGLPLEYDVALMFLEESTTLDDVPLVGVNDDDSFPDEDTMGVAMGWGVTESGETTQQLMEVELEVIGNEECREEKGIFKGVDASMICTFTEGKSPCNGDSGKRLSVCILYFYIENCVSSEERWKLSMSKQNVIMHMDAFLLNDSFVWRERI